VGVVELDANLTESLDLAVNRGVYVTGVVDDSPAARSQIVPSGVDSTGKALPGGDVIVAIEGHRVDSIADLALLLNHYHAHEQVELSLIRDGARIPTPVTLAEWPSEWEEAIDLRAVDPAKGSPESKQSSADRP
jgi:S1-C subfamily serine protease